MHTSRGDSFLLRLQADETYLPVATSLVEKASIAFQLGQSEALSLTLATEEIFLYLCRAVLAGRAPLEISCTSGGYYVQTEFAFSAQALDLHSLDPNAGPSPEQDYRLHGMGLVLALRSVDRFRVIRGDPAGMRLVLVKEKSYPSAGLPEILPPLEPLGPFRLVTPSPEHAQVICHLARMRYPHDILPSLVHFPGKLTDMLESGDYAAAAALGLSGNVGGVIVWRQVGSKIVEFFGPYVFHPQSGSSVGEALVEHCRAATARTKGLVGLLNVRAPSDFPTDRFQELGSSQRKEPDSSSLVPRSAWFQLLGEDVGGISWSDASLADFLEKEYARLKLKREVRIAPEQLETESQHSVLFADVDRQQLRATLCPIWPGLDVPQNLSAHLDLLKAEGFVEILFGLDLGEVWQADFVPSLSAVGFEPRMVLPYAGEGDLLIFQHTRTDNKA